MNYIRRIYSQTNSTTVTTTLFLSENNVLIIVDGEIENSALMINERLRDTFGKAQSSKEEKKVFL